MLKHYEIIHEGIKRFVCDVCDKSFGQTVELKLHRARYHKETLQEDAYKEVSKLSCQYCNEKYSYLYSLNNHINTAHPISKEVLKEQI